MQFQEIFGWHHRRVIHYRPWKSPWSSQSWWWFEPLKTRTRSSAGLKFLQEAQQKWPLVGRVIQGIILPRNMGIMINHYGDPRIQKEWILHIISFWAFWHHFGTYYGMSLQVALPGTKLRKNKGRQHNFRELCEHSPCFSKFGIFYLHVAFWQPSCKGKTNGSLREFRYNSPNCFSVGFLFKASTSLLPWWCGTPKEFFCCSPHGLNLKVESCSHTHVYIYIYYITYISHICTYI